MSENTRQFQNLSEEELERLAHVLAPLCHRGDVLAFHGNLGAGKTVFARAFIRTLTGDGALEVPSPTYTLVQSYPVKTPFPPVWHVDLYRLKDESELSELNLEEAVTEGIVLIEWPEKAEHLLPATRLIIEIAEGKDASTRNVTLRGEKSWRERLRKINLVRR